MLQRTVPCSPRQNGVAERMNRTIMEKSGSMMYYIGVGMQGWAEAVSTALYLINRSQKLRIWKPHFKLGLKMKPGPEQLCVFGSLG